MAKSGKYVFHLIRICPAELDVRFGSIGGPDVVIRH
jgi:hypothetical protein